MQRDRSLAKYWLRPVNLARSTGFSPHELRAIEGIVTENAEKLLEEWREYFAE